MHARQNNSFFGGLLVFMYEYAMVISNILCIYNFGFADWLLVLK